MYIELTLLIATFRILLRREISRIVSSAIQSKSTLTSVDHLVVLLALGDQASYCCSNSFASSRVVSTIFHLNSGTTMSSLRRDAGLEHVDEPRAP